LPVESRFTLFSAGASEAEVVAAVHKIVRDHAVRCEENPPEGGIRVVTTDGENALRLSTMEQIEPGDEFSRMVLGLANWCRQSAGTASDKKRCHDLALAATVAVGVVATPEIQPEDVRGDFVFDLAASLRAVVFTGSSMLDSDGTLLLDAED
jgi:hypothetical protein